MLSRLYHACRSARITGSRGIFPCNTRRRSLGAFGGSVWSFSIFLYQKCPKIPFFSVNPDGTWSVQLFLTGPCRLGFRLRKLSSISPSLDTSFNSPSARFYSPVLLASTSLLVISPSHRTTRHTVVSTKPGHNDNWTVKIEENLHSFTWYCLKCHRTTTNSDKLLQICCRALYPYKR